MVRPGIILAFMSAVMLATSSGVAMRAPSVFDDFSYYVDGAAQYVDGQNDLLEVEHGPNVSVEVSEYALRISCDSVLSGEGEYYELAMQGRVVRPGGATIGSSQNDAYKPSLLLNTLGFDSDPVTGTYECRVDNYVYGYYLGQSVSYINVVRLVPQSLSVVGDQYTQQSFDNYNRRLIYQVRNQFSENLIVSGLTVNEDYALSSDTCNRNPIQTAQAQTNSSGQFQDNYYVQGSGNPGCAQNPSCTTSYTQQLRVAGILVRTNGVVYGCTGVTITEQ
jgi:hypothetical protein